jgi:hypothetical protein
VRFHPNVPRFKIPFMAARDARSTIGPIDAEDRLMNCDRQWQVSSVTDDVSNQFQELGAHEIKVCESDKNAYSASSSHQFYFALAIGGIIAGVGIGWSFGLTTHQLFASNPATIFQKQISETPPSNEKTIPTSNSENSVPVVASREPNTLPTPIREPRQSTKAMPSKTRDDRASSEILTATAHQRGKTLAAAVPETKPQTVEGWMIREVAGNTVVLEGPEGVWRVMQGDTVPGVGKVGSIVRWGNRWIVSTTRGLISTQ